MPPTIVLCYPVQPHHLRQIESACPGARIIASDQERIGDDLVEATVFCGHARRPVDWERIVALGRLEWIQSSAAGLDHCLVPAVIRSGIRVSGASGLFADQVAEQTLALALGLVRRIPQFVRAQRERRFERLECDDFRTRSVVVLGCGGNGFRIASLMAPMVRRLVATDLFPESVPHGVAFDAVDAAETDRVLRDADFVVCTLPLTDGTLGWLDGERLGLIRRGGYFINVGRGQVVREDALIHLLQDGHLAGAGLDVFATEPLPADSPLWEMEQVLVTPHVGAQSTTRYDDVTWLFCENLRRFARDETPWNAVEPGLGFPLPQNRLPHDWRKSLAGEPRSSGR